MVEYILIILLIIENPNLPDKIETPFQDLSYCEKVKRDLENIYENYIKAECVSMKNRE